MFDLIDSQEKIVLAKIGYLLTKYSYQVVKENGDGKNLLECSGLSKLVAKYEDYLMPHSFNGSWKNDNVHFNPGYAINNICSEIESNKLALGMFLKEFIQRINKIDEEDIIYLKNYLEVLGYRLEITFDDYGNDRYSLYPNSEGILSRREDISYLMNMIKEKDDNLLKYYNEAISTYGNSEYQSCISSCRTLFEKIYKSEDLEGDFQKGILNITKEYVSSNPPKLSQIGIFKYWLENKKGFNRYRLFVSMYSLMSGLGPHGEELPTKDDALMCLRITEDMLIWYFNTKNS